MVFSEKLSHQYTLINQQTAAGLYQLKRTATALKQLTALHGVDATAIVAECTSKTAKYSLDKGGDHQAAYQVACSTMVSSMGQLLDGAYKTFLTKVTHDIAAPLYNFYQFSEKMRVTLNEEEHKYTTELASAKSALQKERAACMSAYAATVSKKKQITTLSGEKLLKEQKKYPAMQQKLADLFAGYDASVKSVNELQTLYHKKRMPAIVNELEALERSRLAKVSDVFGAFSAAMLAHIEQLKVIHQNMAFIPNTLNQETAITSFSDFLLARHGRAIPVPHLSYDLPVTASEVKEGDLVKPGLHVPMRKAPIIPVDSTVLKAELRAKYVTGALGRGGTLRARRRDILDSRAKAVTAELSPTLVRQATAEEDHLHELAGSGPETPRAASPEPGSPRAAGLGPGSPTAASHPTVFIAVAHHDYDAAAADEISFKKGERLTVTNSTGPWWTGSNTKGDVGLIPSNFVSSEAEGKADGLVCLVLHDYTPDPGPDSGDYLKLTKGETLTANPRSEEWWYGTCHGRSGFFPMTFVQVLDEEDLHHHK